MCCQRSAPNYCKASFKIEGDDLLQDLMDRTIDRMTHNFECQNATCRLSRLRIAWFLRCPGSVVMKALLVNLLVMSCFAGLFGGPDLLAATFVVVNTLDSGPGSLRQAIEDANANADIDSISFDLPKNDPGYDSQTGVWTIQLLSSLVITHGVTIDGYTQPGSHPNTQPVGQGLNTVLKVVLHFNLPKESPGLFLYYFYHPCVIRGLVFNGLVADGGSLIGCGDAGNVFVGNFFGTDATGNEARSDGLAQTSARAGITSGSEMIVGGTQPADRNLFAGRSMTAIVASHATIQGNLFGTTKDGLAAQHLASAMKIDFLNQVGGAAPGAGNIIVSDGGFFTIVNPPDFPPANHGRNVLEGNFIGTDVTGTLPLGSNTAGLLLQSDSNRIGGMSVGQGNVISGNALGAIKIASQTNVLQGNFIGTQADGSSPLPNGYGILVQAGFFRAASGNLIGSLLGAGGNTIAFNNGSGVAIATSGRNAIYQNKTYGNGGLGIDLGNDGVTPNDPCDAETGPNNLQNYPVLKSVTNTDGNVNITGTLNSLANSTFRLEFFRNDAVDPSGFGEGQVFLGSMDVTTDAGCNATFNTNLPSIAVAQRVTATATDPAGNTSEFSAAIGQPLNSSTRLRVQTGDHVLIGGFIITGTDTKRVIVRGIGPSLEQFFPDFLRDPTLELHGPGAFVTITNDNWKTRPDGSSQQAEIEATDIPPTNDLESAIVATLPANDASYTAVLRGVNDATGIGVMEVYDLDTAANSRLANISTRGLVETGNHVLVGGFIAGNGLTKVIIRAIGPTLKGAGLTNSLLDPTLELYDGSGTTIATNDDWKTRPDGSSQQAEIEATGIPPNDDRESALVRTLPPGAYTAVVRGTNNTTGIGLVEIYNLQ